MNPDTRPIVSLLVAMRNEEDYIERCLRSIIDQDYPADRLEVFIYDGNSTDDSWMIAERIIQNHPHIHLKHNAEQIQSAAWNQGIAESQGDVVGIVSAHAVLAPDYVSQAVAIMHRTGADLVGGPVRAQSEGYVGNAIALAMSTPFGVGGASFRYTHKEQETDTVFMGLCLRETYLKIGGFDLDMVRNQDDELSYRLSKNGGKIVCSPAIRSVYYGRSSLSSLWKQYYQYGFYKVRVLQKHPRQMHPRHFIPSIFVLALIVSGVFLFSPLPALGLIVPVLYLLSNVLLSAITALKRGWKEFPLLPIVYSILHLSYGLGFLVGLVYFRDRWSDKVGRVHSFK